MGRRSFSIAGLPTAVLSIGLFGAGLLPSHLAAESPAVKNASVQIECITPDGRLNAISRAHEADPSSAASIVDDSTVSCLLREGDTTFVIALPTATLRDRFTFINENASARGELTIAVADSRLAANSPEWRDVDGIIPFSHKRLFNLSMLGVETKFMRLTFHVASGHEDSNDRNAGEVQKPFHFSELEAAVTSHFSFGDHGQRAGIGAIFGALSVGPLSAWPNK